MTLDRYARSPRRDVDKYRAALDAAAFAEVMENVTPIDVLRHGRQ